MAERTIIHDIGGGPVLETYERDEPGECDHCGRAVVRVVGSGRTCNTDGTRYSVHPATSLWCMFRCECGEVIADHWRPRLTPYKETR